MFKAAASSIALLTLGLAGCSTTDTSNTPKLSAYLKEQTGQNGRACIQTRDIRGYGASDSSVNIDAGRKYYIATTLYRCVGLDMAPRALFEDRFSEVCGGGTANIITREGRCPLQDIFEFEDRQAAFAAMDLAEETRKADIEKAKQAAKN